MAIVLVGLAGAVFGPAATNAQDPGTTTYTVEMTRINGDRSSVAGVQAADKVQVNPGNPCDDITVTVPAGSADSVILAAADAKSSCHSINTGSRYIDADGDVHNFHSGKRTYWRIIRPATPPPTPAPPTPTPAPTSTPAPTPAPAPTADYTVTHVRVDGPRNSAQAVEDANKTATGTSSGHHEFTLDADATTAAILAAANALSTHSITTGSRYIDASGEVHNFRSGKRTYWLITKSEVNVVEPTPTPDPQNVSGNLTLTGTIADQVLTKGKAYTSAAAFPTAGGVDGTVVYSVLGLPSGITMDSATRKLTGTATAAKAQTAFTYTATDVGPDDTDTDTLTFNLSVLVDYDDDDDGLIEVADLAQLNAIRWDLDGDGTASSGNETTYATAFPNALAGMGCPTSGSPTGCIGYELTADLDFDTNGDGKTNAAGDTYWNAGKGWTPIGELAAGFEGNGHTISNLFVYGPATNAGLFAGIGTGGGVRNLGLTGLNVTGASGKFAGGIAGALTGDARIETSHVTGAVKASGGNNSKAGGLAGSMAGSSQIQKSYAAGTVTASGTNTRAGGLAGNIVGTAQILNSYATASVTAPGGGASAGGLSTFIMDTAKVEYSYATGAVTSTGSNKTAGGLLAAMESGITVTASYWDTETTGQSLSPGGGVGKTTSELQTPTSNTTPYTAAWLAADWDFGTANHYPALKADWNGDGIHTAAEFGDQLIDYDADDDGLIEVPGLGQLNAIRWDLDGNGAAASGNEATYIAAFPKFQAGMGCNEDESAANDQVCTGYELTADLDFDTNGDGVTNVTGDTYWNSGAGWTPIDAFATTLEGNGHTLSNLFINATSGNAGLFATIAAAGEVRNLGLIDVNVSNSSSASNDRAGGLVGYSNGDVTSVYVSGGTVAHTGNSNAGGLIGNILRGGSVKTSWSSAAVSATAALASAGGLAAGIGEIGQAASLADSYATGAVTNSAGRAGGLVGLFFAGTLDDSYATGAVTGATSGGLIGAVITGATVTTSYYDTTTTGQTGDPGKTTIELQTPTSDNPGIYADWSADKWDLRDANNIPLLKADFDGDGNATWQEFGDQDPAPAFAADASIAQILIAKNASYTSDALPEATGGNGTITYSISGQPTDLSLNAARKITGKPTAFQLFKEVTYTATDADGDTATLTFKLGVGPAAPTLTATAGNLRVTLEWTAIPGVSRWRYTQNDGTTTTYEDVPNSSESTTSHTVSGLADNIVHTFSVYAVAEVADDYIIGLPSAPKSATPSGTIDKEPYFVGTVEDKLFVQGVAVDLTLPAALGGDGHPDYVYTLTPAVSGIGLTFTTADHKLTGTPTPQAKVAYTYEAAEPGDSDGTTESDSRTFTIGVHPQKPVNFTATGGNGQVTLSWDAITGVDSWSIRHEVTGASEGNWYTISNSDADTDSHTVTGLTNETGYTFRVVAVVGTGDTEVLGLASDPEMATPTIGAKPRLSAALTMAGADLAWSSNPDVDGWQVKQGSSAWQDIPNSGSATFSHTVTRLAGGVYTFKIRYFVVSGGTRAYSAESNEVSVKIPGRPTFGSKTIADQVYTQGDWAIAGFPAATPAEPPADPNTPFKQSLRYFISPNPPKGITFDNVPPMFGWLGTPETPMAVTTYTYGAREVINLYTTLTFEVSVKPKKPESFSASTGTLRPMLRWDAIAGVSGWEYQKNLGQSTGPWTAILNSNAATASYHVPTLSANKTFTFKVRAFVGTTVDTRVDGVESDGETITTP